MTAFGILFRHGVRERLANTNRLLLSGTVLLIPLVLRGFEGGTGLPGTMSAVWLSLILGAGLIGQDTASGVLQLVLARPVVRLHYILARWLAAGCLAAGATMVQTGLIAALMGLRGSSVHAAELAAVLAAQASVALGVTAVMAAFSAMVAGLGDIRIWLLVLLLGQVIELVGQAKHLAWLSRTGAELAGAMVPGLVFDAAAPGGWWYPLLRWVSTVVLALAVASEALNRKELSYGAA